MPEVFVALGERGLQVELKPEGLCALHRRTGFSRAS